MNPKWSWTEQKRNAAQLIAAGHLKKTQIANKVGVNVLTLRRWSEYEEFKTQIEQHQQANQQKLDQEIENQEQTKADCQNLFDQVTEIIQEITKDELRKINQNPIAAINLWLRLHNAVHNQQRKFQTYEDDDTPPNLAELEPEVAQRIMDVISREHQKRNPIDCQTSPELLSVSRTDDEL